MASQTLPKTIPNPLKIPEKTSSQNARVFKAIFKRIFGNFDLKIHRFFDDFLMHVAIMHGKREFVQMSKNHGKTNGFYWFLRFWTCKKPTNFNKKGLKMRVPKKHRKNRSRNRFSEPFWPPKPLQNRRKIDEKTMWKKSSKKEPKKSQHDPEKKNPPASVRGAPGTLPSLGLPPL